MISDNIRSLYDGILMRSVIQSLLTVAVLFALFAYLIRQNRKTALLRIEEESSEAANRVRQSYLEQQLALREQLLQQKERQEQQEKMITALASDYRSVYYVEPDKDAGTCYQSRHDLHGLRAGDRFNYLESVTNYCNTYILEAYREEFLRFVQPDAIRAGLREHPVISFRYMIRVDGVETTRQIRAIVGHDTPIIILTSFNWDEIEEEAREAGVDTFVAKPLFAGNVMDEFREAFKRKNAALERRTVNLEGRRVLLAEDVAVNAEIMMMVLAMRKMEAEHAENGQVAVEMFRDHAPGCYDAILMDMRMPVMDGLEATKAIRELPREDARRIPIIALTANAFDEDVQRSMQAGLNAHLSKPVEPEVLFETMQSLIQP